MVLGKKKECMWKREYEFQIYIVRGEEEDIIIDKNAFKMCMFYITLYQLNLKSYMKWITH